MESINLIRGFLIKIAVCLPVICALTHNSLADSPSASPDTLRATQYFRCNVATLDDITPDMRALARSVDSLYRLQRFDSLLLVGSASPEGPADLNQRLAKRRAENVADYLRFSTMLPDSAIITKGAPASWSDLSDDLRNPSVTTLSSRRDSIFALSSMEIIDTTPGDPSPRLRKSASGNLWNWLASEIFPIYRTASASAYFRGEVQPFGAGDAPLGSLTSEETRGEESSVECRPAMIEEWQRGLYIKSNLPAWLCLWTNAAVEIDIARHWSAALPIYYSGFNYFKRNLKFRTFAIQPEIRWWPSPRNHGFFLGAHFGMAYYNLALCGDTRYQDKDGKTPALGGGLAAGWRFRLNSDPNLTMEASIGGGIYKLHYNLFQNRPNGMLIGTRRRTFYGIDQAALSITYRFGIGKRHISPAHGGRRAMKGGVE